MNRISTSLPVFHVAFCVIAMLLGNSAIADHRIVEGFEGIEPSWKLNVQAANSTFQIKSHSRTRFEKKSGKQSELIHFHTTRSSNAKLIHSINHAQVIHDFCPQIALRSTRNGIRFNARLVLPRTKNPLGDGPLTLLVRIAESKEVGTWETVGASEGEIVQAMRHRLRSIQNQYQGLKVVEQDAYCDLLVLDGFEKTGGEAKIWIDDLSISGLLPAKLGTGAGQQQLNISSLAQKVTIQGTKFVIGSKPIFLRALKHNGESMAFVKRMGFNAVVLSQLPTETQLADARQYSVWILCPPPQSNQDIVRSKNANMIFAWNVGENFTSSELAVAKRVVQRIANIDFELKLPTFCSAHYPTEKYATIVDFLRLGHSTYGTSFSLDRFEEYLSSKSPTSKPLLVDVQTMIPREAITQGQMISKDKISPWLSFDQLREVAYHAIRQGSRGLIFDSNTNLEQTRKASEKSINRLTRLNWELLQIDPWIAGGTVIEKKNSSGQSSTTFALERSQLVWVVHKRGQLQPRDRLFSMNSSQRSPRVYHVNANGILPAQHHLSNGLLRVTLDRDDTMEFLIVSEDSISFRYVQDVTNSFPDRGLPNVRLKLLIGRHSRLQNLFERLSRKRIRNPAIYSALQDTAKSLVITQSLLDQNQPSSALSLITKTEHQIDEVTRAISQKLLVDPEVCTSAFSADFQLLETSVDAKAFSDQATWSPNVIDENSFSSISNLAKAGWKQNINEIAGTQSQVRLLNKQIENDKSKHSLKMDAWQIGPSQTNIDVTPIWLSSPNFPVKQTQFVRIEGLVKIDRPIGKSADGLMIIDSIGGPTLARREYKTDGWKKFVIERIAESDTKLQVVFALTGLGSVELSELSIRTSQELFSVE